ncbi:hypothetical protein HKCCE4037_15035 [Rhodobacterales bacterium HKCCE4037]|nr:hypothetical protein [Rhodobacterales bacterium HKCCE4037]
MKWLINQFRYPSFSQLKASIRIAHGNFDPSALTVYSVMRNEHYCLAAFLDHHRKLGVEQFLILDDSSDTAFRAMLESEKDVVVLVGKHRFGATVLTRKGSPNRAGTEYKNAIPERFLFGKYSLYLDADEFLLLPPSCPTLPDLISFLENRNLDSCSALMIEFFPETWAVGGELANSNKPNTSDEMFDRYPWFDRELRLGDLSAPKPEVIGRTKSEKLMSLFFDPADRIDGRRFGSPKTKFPIARVGDDAYRNGSHQVSGRRATDRHIALAHFVLRRDFEAKAHNAILEESHVNGSSKYKHYGRLIKELDGKVAALRDDDSLRYTGPAQLLDLGLMRWPAG